jgi:plasmid stability protein
VPEQLHEWLKRQAQNHHRSVSKEVIALLESLRKGAHEPARRESAEEILEIGRRCAELPELDSRSADEISSLR